MMFLAIICVLLGCTTSSTGAILDSLTIILLGDIKDDYGKQRLYASIAWGLSSLLTGVSMDISQNPWVKYNT
jgi:hypothetical protein